MLVGESRAALETPALWVDLDCMERNIQRLASRFRSAGVQWRPHTKGIKVPAICHQLLKAGAIGMTCAKLSEAEVLAAAGIGDIFIANEIVGASKIQRLVNLRRHADVMVAVDSIENAGEISRVAVGKGVKIRVLVEVNIGINRCGVEPGQPVIELARKLMELPGIELKGVMGWEGHVVRIADRQEKERRCREAVEALVQSAEPCRALGMPMPIVSCGGTGTFDITPYIPGVTEIQAGGGIFNALYYRKWGVDLEFALFILATVISRPTATRAVIDAGRRAMGGEMALPQPRSIHGVHLARINAEHGVLELDDAQVAVCVGDKIDLIASYIDDTIFLHDKLYGVRNDRVEVVWDIQGRGKIT